MWIAECYDTILIRWENGWYGLGGFARIFLNLYSKAKQKTKKSVPISPIRTIRSPIVSQSYHKNPKSTFRNLKNKQN
jgi:hypothetical protein